MTHTSEAAMDVVEQIKRDESLSLKPYRDSVGKLTIGYGTNLDDGITRDEADYLLHNRLNVCRIEVARILPWVTSLSEQRQAVLYNMAYNLGVQGLLLFNRTLDFIENGRYADAAVEMLRSKWAHQVGDRAHRLAIQMEQDKWV